MKQNSIVICNTKFDILQIQYLSLLRKLRKRRKSHRFHKFSKTAAGGFVLCGDINTQTSTGLDLMVINLDATGNIIWSGTAGGALFERGYDVFEASDGGFVSTGVTKSYGYGNEDIYMVRFDAGGNGCCANPISLSTNSFGSINTELILLTEHMKRQSQIEI